VALLGVKGDWPALTKLGGLTRHHGREAHKTDSAGICHLCRAGQPGFNFHRFDFTSMQAARTEEMPWLRPSSLSRKVPQSPSKREQFYKIDTFHVGHKGVMGDLCANAIATRHVQAVANTKQVLLHVLKVVVLKTTNRKGQTSAIAFHVLKSSLSTKVALFDLQIDGMAISSGIDTVYDQLVAFAKENSLPLHMLQLSRTILGFANSWSFPAASLDVLSKITFSDAFFGNF